jgi:hypothetical protein
MAGDAATCPINQRGTESAPVTPATPHADLLRKPRRVK